MHDAVIIGGGVIGSAIARELSRYDLDIVLLERGSDVASGGASKANSGIVHAGYDAKSGTRKAHYNMLGQKMFERLSAELDFPFKRCGSLVLAFDDGGKGTLEALKAQGEVNGLDDLRIIGRDELLEMEPNIGEGARWALDVPSGGIVCPYELTIALAENAAENGVRFYLNCAAHAVRFENGVFIIESDRGELRARALINAAGLYADEINNQLSEVKHHITPRRGEYCLLDRSEGGLISRTLFQLPTKMGKGVLVTPTVDGNLMIGPTSMDIDDKGDTATTADGLAEVLEKGALSAGAINRSKIITSFAGLRAHPDGDDFVVGEAPDVPGFFNALGIESPGLTSAPAIGADVAHMVANRLSASEKSDFKPERRAAPRFRHLSDDERRALIAQDPDWGQIVCRCETVTKAEILAALRSPLKVRDLDAIKRRTRAGMGRCQGGFCHMRLPHIIAEECGIALSDVVKKGPGTELLVMENRAEME